MYEESVVTTSYTRIYALLKLILLSFNLIIHSIKLFIMKKILYLALILLTLESCEDYYSCTDKIKLIESGTVSLVLHSYNNLAAGDTILVKPHDRQTYVLDTSATAQKAVVLPLK